MKHRAPGGVARLGHRWRSGCALLVLACSGMAASLGPPASAASGRLIRTVPVGQVPVAVAVDAPRRRVYVASFAGNSVAVLDARTGAVVRVIGVGHCPNDVAVDVRTRHAFVANWDDATISVIDTTRQALLRTVPVGLPPGAA